jgi:hypothetical protein
MSELCTSAVALTALASGALGAATTLAHALKPRLAK